jgi:selenophosphate synthase
VKLRGARMGIVALDNSVSDMYDPSSSPIEALGVTLMPSMKFTFTIESLFDIRTKVRNTNLNSAEPCQMSIPSTTRLIVRRPH